VPLVDSQKAHVHVIDEQFVQSLKLTRNRRQFLPLAAVGLRVRQ